MKRQTNFYFLDNMSKEYHMHCSPEVSKNLDSNSDSRICSNTGPAARLQTRQRTPGGLLETLGVTL